MNAGIINIEGSLLCKLLGLPEGTKLREIRSSRRLGCWALFIEHPDLPRVDEGQEIPELNPVYQRDVVRFVDWGASRLDTKQFEGWLPDE